MAKVVHHNRRGEFVVTGAVLGAALGVGFSYLQLLVCPLKLPLKLTPKTSSSPMEARPII